MSASKLKNIVLLVLALADFFLLVLVVPQRVERQRQNAREKTQLVRLFADVGVTLEEKAIPDGTVLYPTELVFDREKQLETMEALLRAPVQRNERTYTTELIGSEAHGLLDAGGGMMLTFNRPEKIEDPVSDAEARLTEAGLAHTAPVADPAAETVTAFLTYSELPVYSAPLTFFYEDGALRNISGMLPLAQSAVRTDRTASVSAKDALVAFLSGRTETGWIGTRILSVRQGYVAAASASSRTAQLTPCWYLETDTGAFFVDGITSAVSAAEEVIR